MKVHGLCVSGKVGYLDQIDAHLALATLRAKDRDELNVYPCKHCDLYHLTSGDLYE